jgi:acetyltransferase-like isoleucine patch superfamily enzyme
MPAKPESSAETVARSPIDAADLRSARRGRDLAAARLREALARRKGLDPAAVQDWGGRDLASLLCTLGGRAARGALVRARLGHAEGLVLCGPRVRLYQPWHIRAGRDLSLDEACEIVGLSRRGIVFGDRCTVGRFATIQPTNKLFDEPGEGLRVGSRSNIGHFAYIGCSGFIDIGDDVLMGPRVSLLAENHVIDDIDTPMKDQGVTRSFIRIEDDCWIGSGSVVLAGVTIGRGSVVAAGSVVTRDVPPFSIVGGAPARLIRSRRPDEAPIPGAGGRGRADGPDRPESSGAAALAPDDSAGAGGPDDPQGAAAPNA